MDGERKFHCINCKGLRSTHRGICKDCGALIGCPIVSPNEGAAFHGCQDNLILLEEMQKLTRTRTNLLMTLYRILTWKSSFGEPRDYLIQQALKDIKQIARNELREYEIDEKRSPKT